MVDEHSQKVSAPVWEAYRYMLSRCGSVPTLIEWDTDLPEWSGLLGEVEKAAPLPVKRWRRYDTNSYFKI